MKVIILEKNDEQLLGIAEALEYSNIEVLLWDEKMKSSFDMVSEQRPDLVISDFSMRNTNELDAAIKKYGGKLYIKNDGLHLDIFANLVQPKLAKNRLFECDAAMIVDNIQGPDIQYIHEVLRLIEELNTIKFRIYGDIKINSPYYVGSICREQKREIYANTKVLIDLYGEHYLNPFLFGNFSVCEMIKPEYEKFDNGYSIDDLRNILSDKAITIYEDEKPIFNEAQTETIERYKKDIILNHNNFKETCKILRVYSFDKEEQQVKEAEERIINERWNISR